MIHWGPHWWGRSSLEDRKASQVMNFFSSNEEDYHQNLPKKDTLTLLVNLVFWRFFEDILTRFYSSRVWVQQISERHVFVAHDSLEDIMERKHGVFISQSANYLFFLLSRIQTSEFLYLDRELGLIDWIKCTNYCEQNLQKFLSENNSEHILSLT